MTREATITSDEIREVITHFTLTRLTLYLNNPSDLAISDSFASIIFLGPPGVGKSALQFMASKDIAMLLSEERKKTITAEKISQRISIDDAIKLANSVIDGNVIPYLHLYLPQLVIWDLQGTPSPESSYALLKNLKVPITEWRYNPFILPLRDYTKEQKPENVVPAFLVLDEFNMASNEILSALFQLARSAELGSAKLNPLTTITLIGNTPETNLLASKALPEPLINRASVFKITKPSVKGWIAYMNEVYENKWDERVGGYFMLNEDKLYYVDPSDPSIIQTPRNATFVATYLWALNNTAKKYNIDYWSNAEKILKSNLVSDVASDLIGYLRGLMAVNLNDILKTPEKIESLDKNIVAYIMIKLSSKYASDYSKEKDIKKKEKMISDLAEVTGYASKVLGAEAISIALDPLPLPMRLSLAKKLPAKAVNIASETEKKVREIREILNGA